MYHFYLHDEAILAALRNSSIGSCQVHFCPVNLHDDKHLTKLKNNFIISYNITPMDVNPVWMDTLLQFFFKNIHPCQHNYTHKLKHYLFDHFQSKDFLHLFFFHSSLSLLSFRLVISFNIRRLSGHNFLVCFCLLFFVSVAESNSSSSSLNSSDFIIFITL